MQKEDPAVRRRGEEGASGEPGMTGEEEKVGDVADRDDDDEDEMLADVGDDTVAMDGSHHEANFS
jgi:hypothetical protein